MRRISILLLGLLVFASCKNEPEQKETAEVQDEISIEPVNNDVLESAVIYEANIRQYSPEGTFAAFTKDIPQLKELGVKVIWLMPVYPISEVRRKATGDKSIEDIEDAEERKKYLGSYYAIGDYTKVNPEFGTKEDFDDLVQTAHDNGIYVILDWVANHTGWDHAWLKEHPEFYTQNDKGEPVDPLNPETGESWGWTDVADLNYDNKELWEAMTAEMKYWVDEHDIDGFRADVAGEVPTEFWEQAVPKLEATKPLFMLAESEEKELFHKAFQMGYNWEGHHLKNQIAQGKATVEAWDDYMKKIDTTYQQDDYLMNFVTNHDENSWSGTVKERMGSAAETMVALSYTIPGMPLIYSGQEYDLDHRLKFFEKDSIPRTKGVMWPLLEKLGKLKNSNPALHGGKEAASYKRLETTANEKVLAFERSKNGARVVYIANMTNEPVTFDLKLDGNLPVYHGKTDFKIQEDGKYQFNPWEYVILSDN
ncbi:alpha-amylase family glycosyl hydrolase [Salinimicrobium oceani]|uniref:Alpha-amylase n=1 Tax=Salinimicrobium oceani TaxID=2722702 RepID=A0ABX1CTR7_9FLAO|nr:alpha-amylase family glycosyl hydrolase [Salinimicrobium oceani]NJW51315.1 alpha-amylase [Salinimicrobium oceani]